MINTYGVFVYLSQGIWQVRRAEKGHVVLNEQTVKPSREVMPTDQIKVRKEQIWRQLDVISIPKSRVSAKIVGLYCVEKIDIEDLERTQLQQLTAHAKRDHGSGRPTKKETKRKLTISIQIFQKKENFKK